MISQKLGRGRRGPVEMWAVGRIVAPAGTGGLDKGICYYKPIGGPWQLQFYEPWDLLRQERFQSVYRRAGDPAGTVWVGGYSRASVATIPNLDSGAGLKSTDYGETWTRYFIDDPHGSFLSLSNAAAQIFLTAENDPTVVMSGRILKLVGGNFTEIAAGGIGYPAGRNTAGSVSGVYCLTAGQSPTKAPILKMVCGINQLLEIWRSDNSGASWVIETVLTSTIGTRNGSGGAAVTADKRRFIFSEGAAGGNVEVYWSDDAVSWTKVIPGQGGNSLCTSGIGGPTRKRWVAGGGTVNFTGGGAHAGSQYRTSDAGVTWVSTTPAFTKMRYLGNAFYAVNLNNIFVSRDQGRSWQTESLPALPIAGTVSLSDINGI